MRVGAKLFVLASLACSGFSGPAIGVNASVIGFDAFDCTMTFTANDGGATATYVFPTKSSLANPDAGPPAFPGLGDCQSGADDTVDLPCDVTGPHPTLCRRHDSCLQIAFQSQTNDLQTFQQTLGATTFTVVATCGQTVVFSAPNLTANQPGM